MECYFDHEKLRVYQEAIAIVAWCEDILERCKAPAAVKDHFDRSSTGIPLNIAEGNAKYSSKDQCRFLDIARGCALECAACLDVLVAKRRLPAADTEPGKKRLHGIVSMLVGLHDSIADRVNEEPACYKAWDPGEGI